MKDDAENISADLENIKADADKLQQKIDAVDEYIKSLDISNTNEVSDALNKLDKLKQRLRRFPLSPPTPSIVWIYLRSQMQKMPYQISSTRSSTLSQT